MGNFTENINRKKLINMYDKNNNVVQFPKDKLETTANIQTQEDVLNRITSYKTSFAEDISEILSQHIFGELARSGVNFERDIDDLFPSMILVTEAMQSLHLKSSGVYHPLQDFAEDVYSDEESEENDENVKESVDKTENEDYNGSNRNEDIDGE